MKHRNPDGSVTDLSAAEIQRRTAEHQDTLATAAAARARQELESIDRQRIQALSDALGDQVPALKPLNDEAAAERAKFTAQR